MRAGVRSVALLLSTGMLLTLPVACRRAPPQPAHGAVRPAPRVTPKPVAPRPTNAVPLSCAESVFDFGVRGLGQEVSHTFTLHNAGTEPVLIEKVVTNCACAPATLTAARVPPGQSTQVQIRLSLSTAGARSARFEVIGREPRFGLTLQTRGEVLGAVVALAGRVVPPLDLGDFTVDTVVRRHLDLGAGAKGELPAVVAVTPAYLHVELEALSARYAAIEVRAEPDAPLGAWSGAVQLRLTAATAHQVSLPLAGAILSDLYATPAVLDVSRPDALATHFVRIRSRTERPFRIRETQAPAGITVALATPGVAAAEHRLRLSLRPDEPAGGRVLILTDEEHRTAEIELQ